MPVYNGLLWVITEGIQVVNSFIDNFEPLGVVFNVVWRTVKNLWNSMVDLFYTVFPTASQYSFSMSNAVKILATAIMLLMTPLIAIRGLIVAMIDAMSVATNGIKMMAAAAKGDFVAAAKHAADLSVSWDRLKNRASDNFGSIKNSFSEIWASEKKNLDSSLKNNETYNSGVKNNNQARTIDEKAELDKRAKARKEAAEEEKRLQKETDDLLEKMYKESLELKKEMDDQEVREKKETSKLLQDIVSNGEKAILKIKEEQGGKGIDAQKRFAQMVNVINKGIADEQERIHKEAEEKQKAREQRRIEREHQVSVELLNIASFFFDSMARQLIRQMDASTDYVEKAMIQQKLNSLAIAEEALNGLGQLAQGNVVGAVVSGVKVIFSALDNWVSKTARLTEANLAKLRDELKAAGEDFVKSIENFGTGAQFDKIREFYGQFLQSFDAGTLRIDLGDFDTYERRLEQEIRIAERIKENYDTAVSRENDYSAIRLKNIDEAYQKDIAGINAKYALLDQLANASFDAETLKLKESQSEQLNALISNEESKTALYAEYAKKRSEIVTAYSLADQVITADTDQATIDAINAAIEARNKALVNLQNWYNTELEYVVNSEGQKQKEYKETEKIKIATEDALTLLAIQRDAEAIERNRLKNIELENAEALKNLNLENEAIRHNNELVKLGLEKDRLLSESFLVLKDIITNGYDDMMNAAMDALNAGKITADQYNEIANRLFNIKNLIGEIDWSKLTMPNFDLPNLNLPKFASGTEFLDPSGKFGFGTDKVPLLGDRGERILSAAENAAIYKTIGRISNPDLVKLAIGNSVGKNSGMVEKIGSSSIANAGSVERGGAGVYTDERLYSAVMQMIGAIGDVKDVIVDKPIFSMSMLTDAADAVAENINRSKFG